MSTRLQDDTDLEILRLLAENARRPYCEIAEQVDLSAPAVSDRVAKLAELGVIRRFTIDIDRTRLYDTIPVLVVVHPNPAAVSTLQQSLLEAAEVEHVFTTADAELVFSVELPDSNVGAWLQDTVEMDDIEWYEVRLLSTMDCHGASLGPTSDLPARNGAIESVMMVDPNGSAASYSSSAARGAKPVSRLDTRDRSARSKHELQRRRTFEVPMIGATRTARPSNGSIYRRTLSSGLRFLNEYWIHRRLRA